MKNTLLKEELLTIFKNKKILIPIIAVLFIPVLYAGMFLWAFWDPYAKLDKLPVAVVNSDRGATLDGERLKLGDDLVKKLEKSKEFGFKSVEKSKGYQDIKNQKYYMLIEIPEDFSENATTLLDKNPKKLNLIYVPNEGYNFLSAQIGGTAAYKIKTALAEKVTETYAETIFNKVTDLADGIKQASDGAGQLSDGSADIKSGSTDLKDGLMTLASKYVEFNNGLSTANSGAGDASSGSKDLANGLGQLQQGEQQLEASSDLLNSGSKDLAAGIKQAKDGIQYMNGEMPQLVGGTQLLQSKFQVLAESLQKGSKDAADGASQLNDGIAKLDQILQSPLPEDQKEAAMKQVVEQLKIGSTALKGGTQALNAGTGYLSGGEETIAGQLENINKAHLELQQGVKDLAAGSSILEGGAAKLTDGQDQFAAGLRLFGQKFSEAKAGADKLAKGTNDLSSGMNQLATGSNAIYQGVGQLTDGSNQLADGTVQLSDGANELADKLKDGASEASKVHTNGKTYDMMAKPVKLETDSLNRVPNYGTGFTPYFLSLGLFVGALILSIVFPFREPAVRPSSALNWFITKFAILAVFGIIQALLADTIILSALGLHVESVPKFVLFSIITSLTFVTLIQVLVSVFADVGRFVAILILIFQLTTSAGTFPLELIPNFLQHFNAFLPMTYTVRGFKAVISSGDYSVMWQNAIMLSVFIVIFITGSLAYFTMRYKHDYKHSVTVEI